MSSETNADAIAGDPGPQDEPQAPRAGLDTSQPAELPVGPPSAPEAPFPPEVPAAQMPCSYNRCLAGHVWPAVLALAKCPGCTGAIIAVQKTNCPFCNEPIAQSILRSDFIPRGAGLAKRCQGEPIPGESLDIELARTQWQEVETTTRTFLEQQAAERAAAKN